MNSLRTAFFIKNVPAWERALRTIAGISLAWFAIAAGSTTWQWLGGAAGVELALTGFVGFCPMCALAGRRLDRARVPTRPSDRLTAHRSITIVLYNAMVSNAPNAETRLDAIFMALADPTRRAILARLARGDATVAELAEPFEISQPAISKHLKVLERARLISIGQDAQRRPRRLSAQPLAEASAWLERYRAAWETNYQRLDELLEELQRPTPRKPLKNT
jgi:DNA-binding transcriptional ArsR family regulator